MAEMENLLIDQTTETVSKSLDGTTIAVTYGSIIIMALVPIFFGSYRTVNNPKEKHREIITNRKALMFPVIQSCVLFGLYIIVKLSSKENRNISSNINLYVCLLGVSVLTEVLSPMVTKLASAALPNIQYHIWVTKKKSATLEDIINYRFSSHDVIALLFSLMVGAWYLVEKHWIANNLFALSFAIYGIDMLYLKNVVTGCILLSALFLYDIFWVFGTDVMITIAQNVEGPFKVVFPQDLLTNGLAANNFAILGLGDIVIPGIFIALLLRFDLSLQRKSNLYFLATFAAYFLSLITTIFVMHVFKCGQPALLYLVPACLGTPLAVAVAKGDLTALFEYEENEDQEEENEEQEEESSESTEVKKVG